jgi:ABC-2 type transport system permease protein
MEKPGLRSLISQGLHDVFYIWRREIIKCFKDQGVFIFFIIVPLGYPLLYSFIYTEEVVRDVPAIAVDEDHSSISREFLRKVDATPDVQVVAYSNDMADARQALREHKAYGIIRIPADFSKNIFDINRFEQGHVNIYCDMGSMFYYKALLASCTDVSLDMNKRIKVERAGNTTTDREEQISTQPVEYQNVALFNPQSGFASFLIPAVLMLILQQTLVLGIGMSAGTAVETNRFRNLVPINRHYNGTIRIVFGKALCYFMIYAVCSAWVLLVVPRIFSLNHLAQASTLTLFMIPYLTACIFFAMTVSVLVRSRENSIILFAFMSVPILFLSGISWPGTGIPTFWKYFSFIFPSTFGINGFVRINNLSADLFDVQMEYHALWLQTGVYFFTTFLVYRWQILSSRIHFINRYRTLKEQHLAKETAATEE